MCSFSHRAPLTGAVLVACVRGQQVWRGAVFPLGGTSASGPIMAGIVSLLNDVLLNKGLPVVGHFNPTLYRWAESSPAPAFNDITFGRNNDGDMQPPGSFYPIFCEFVAPRPAGLLHVHAGIAAHQVGGVWCCVLAPGTDSLLWRAGTPPAGWVPLTLRSGWSWLSTASKLNAKAMEARSNMPHVLHQTRVPLCFTQLYRSPNTHTCNCADHLGSTRLWGVSTTAGDYPRFRNDDGSVFRWLVCFLPRMRSVTLTSFSTDPVICLHTPRVQVRTQAHQRRHAHGHTRRRHT